MPNEGKRKIVKQCHICGNVLYGNPGVQYELVENRGQTRCYCRKCLENIFKEGKN